MIRNHILRQFLYLSPEDRTLQNLKRLKGTSNDFEVFISNIGATSYAYEIMYKTEQQLILDYRHVNHKDADYFLEQLLRKSEPVEKYEVKAITEFFSKLFNIIKKAINIVGLSISWLITIFFVICIIGVVISTIRNHESTTLEADSNGNSNAIIESDSDNKMRSLDVQIEDHSTSSGFGNAGIIGNDSSENSLNDTTTESVVDAPLATTPYKAVKSDDYSFEKDTEDDTSERVSVKESEPTAIDISEDTFTIGSTKDQVEAFMGNPTKFRKFLEL